MDNTNGPQILTPPPAPTQPQAVTPPPMEIKRRNPLGIILMGLVVLVLIGGTALYLTGKAKKDNTILSVPTVTTSATPLPTEVITQEVAPTITSEITNVYVDSVKNTTNQKREFASNTAIIYAHVDLVPNSQNLPGQVKATLLNVATGDLLGPVGVNITQPGPQGADFSFTKPTNGWPKGELKATFSFGDSSRDYTFSVK